MHEMYTYTKATSSPHFQTDSMLEAFQLLEKVTTNIPFHQEGLEPQQRYLSYRAMPKEPFKAILRNDLTRLKIASEFKKKHRR